MVDPLIAEYCKDKSNLELRNQIIKQYYPAIIRYSKKYYYTCKDRKKLRMTEYDMIQVGAMAAMKVLDYYKPEIGKTMKFQTALATFMRFYMSRILIKDYKQKDLIPSEDLTRDIIETPYVEDETLEMVETSRKLDLMYATIEKLPIHYRKALKLYIDGYSWEQVQITMSEGVYMWIIIRKIQKILAEENNQAIQSEQRSKIDEVKQMLNIQTKNEGYITSYNGG